MEPLSKCFGTWLHNYKIIKCHYKADYFMVEELCFRCHDRKFFKMKKGGQVDNLNYIKYHVRQALPKHHPLFNHEYRKQHHT